MHDPFIKIFGGGTPRIDAPDWVYVLEQKLGLLLIAYMRNRLSIDTKMNDLDLCSEVVSRSLPYIRR